MGDEGRVLKRSLGDEGCVNMRRLCVGVCTCMLAHVHLWRMLSHPPCGGCLLFNPESPDSAVLKSEVYIILIMVYYIFPHKYNNS